MRWGNPPVAIWQPGRENPMGRPKKSSLRKILTFYFPEGYGIFGVQPVLAPFWEYQLKDLLLASRTQKRQQ
jgi:hypothetical protein